MPIPNLSYVTLTGTFVNLLTAGPSVGQLRFVMPFQLVNTATNTIVVPRDFSAVLDGSGSFSLSLPCTDDPDFLPDDRFWSVTEIVDGHTRTYAILLPASPSTQDLADIAPIEPTDPLAVYTLLGSSGLSWTPQTGTFTFGSTDDGALVTTGSSTVTANGPVSPIQWHTYWVEKADSGSGKVVFDPQGSVTVNGFTTWEITEQYERYGFMYDGAAWNVV